MNVTRTIWDDESVRRSGAVNLLSRPYLTVEDQPAFGASIFWNEPTKWWKPAIQVHFWRWYMQAGWLFDFPDGYKDPRL